MTRKILFEHEGRRAILEEAPAPEIELQEVVKHHPELLPIEDFGMAGPLLVIGRETPLPSGAVDLAGLSRAGDLLLVEFKIGPANPDFRHATSQLLDYGSDLWGMSVEDLERTVALPYFHGRLCPEGSPGHRAGSLEEAARRAWPDASDDDLAACWDRLAGALRSGAFHHVVAAQRFTEPALRTISYLDETSRASFYAVELVRFTGPAGTATEARTVYRPEARAARGAQRIDEEAFLGRIEDPGFRSSLERVLDAARHAEIILLHIHGERIMFEQLTDYPVNVINWHDRKTHPTLAEARELYSGTIAGGVDSMETIGGASPEKVVAEVRDAIAQTKGHRHIVTAGCVIPIDAPDANLRAVRQAVEVVQA